MKNVFKNNQIEIDVDLVDVENDNGVDETVNAVTIDYRFKPNGEFGSSYYIPAKDEKEANEIADMLINTLLDNKMDYQAMFDALPKDRWCEF